MGKGYLDCKNGLTSQCPQIDNSIMQILIGQPTGLIRSTEHFTARDLEKIDLLCNECDSFIPRKE